MKRSIVFLLVCFITLNLQAQEYQSERKVINITQFSSGELNGVQNTSTGIRSAASNQHAEFIRYDIAMPLEEVSSFIAFAIVWEAQLWNPEKDALWVRFKGGTEEPSWQKMDIDVHSHQNGTKHISELTYVDKYVDKLDIKIVFAEQSAALVSNLKLHFYNPGKVEKKAGQKTEMSSTRAACTCPQPDFENRADWCPAGDCPPHPNPSVTDVTHLIIHHSAGSNTSSDWAAVVRSIWDYHVNVNGWSDIGYNWLVDPNGVLYEGRGDNILGAHFCGTNTNTMGVCVMGDFTNISPTLDAKTMLKNLLVWKICDIDADPEGSAFHAPSGIDLNHISGHQDGCATACPGASFYPQVPTIRMEVSDQIDNSCENEDLVAPTNLEAEVLSSSSIALSWTDNANNENTFIIERSIMTNSNFEIIGTTNSNETTYTDENLQANTAYFYQVKAANEQDTTIYTNQIGVATVLTSSKNVDELPLLVYPNPVKDWLSIDFPEGSGSSYNINVFEMASSKFIKSYTAEMNTQRLQQSIDVSNLAKGIYLLQVTDGIKQRYVKLVKE